MLPPDMVVLPRWCTWNLTQDGKKIPNQKVNDPKSWLTLEEALKNPGSGGIGFIFNESDDLGGIDCDSARDPVTGALEPWCQQLVSMFDSYTEVSPSGTGVKIFAKGAPPSLPGSVIPIKEGKSHGDKRPQIEVYVKGRFFAVTGAVLPDFDPQAPLAVASSAWLKMVELLSAMTVASGKRQSKPRLDGAEEDPDYTPPESVVTRGSRNLSLTRLAGVLRRQGLGVESIEASLLIENERKCKPPLTREEISTIARSVVRYTPTEDTGNPFGGKINVNSQPHLLMALDRMNVSLAYNSFMDEPEITYPKSIFGGEDETMITEVLDETHRRRLYFILERDFFVKTSVNILDDFLQDQCRSRPYHPIRNYFNTLKWDKTPRIDTWLETYMGVRPDNEETKKYVSAVGAITLMAAVRRVLRPGCKFDNMLILEGIQNIGKSMSLMALSPDEEYVLEDFSLGTDAKIAIERTVGKFLVEVSEMVVSRSADINKVKAFLSLRRDVARKVYGRKTTKQPRAFIFIGTTNELSYLASADGNRRYWPVKCDGKIDIAGIKEIRAQLWAEALFKEPGAELYLTDELFKIAVKQQSAREVTDPWQERLENIAGSEAGWWRFDSLWSRLDKPVGQASSTDSRRLSMILHRMKFHSEVRYIKRLQKGIRVWMRFSADNHDPAVIPAFLPEDAAWEEGREGPVQYEKEPTFL